MLAWVKRVLSKIQTPDGVAMSVGLVGFVSLVAGIAMVSVPAAFVVAGLILMCWSAIFARAIANDRGDR